MSGRCAAKGSFSGGFGKIYKTSFMVSELAISKQSAEFFFSSHLCALDASLEPFQAPELLSRSPVDPPHVDPAIPPKTHDVVTAPMGATCSNPTIGPNNTELIYSCELAGVIILTGLHMSAALGLSVASYWRRILRIALSGRVEMSGAAVRRRVLLFEAGIPSCLTRRNAESTSRGV